MTVARASLNFDGAITYNPGGKASGGMLLKSGGRVLSASSHFFGSGEGWTCNTAEYEALLRGLRIAIRHKVKSLTVYGDSKFVIKTASGVFRPRNSKLRAYCDECKALESRFESVCYEWVPREENQETDALTRMSR